MSDATSNFSDSSTTNGSVSSSRGEPVKAGYFLLKKRWHLIAAAQFLDVTLVLLIAVLTYNLLRYRSGGVEPLRYVWASAAIGVSCHIGFARGHLYEIGCIGDASKAYRYLLVHWTRIFLFFAAGAALTHRDGDFSRAWFLCLYVTGAGLFAMERVLLAAVYRAGLRRGYDRKNVAIVGSERVAETLIKQLHKIANVRIVGAYTTDLLGSDASPANSYVSGVPIRGGVDALLQLSRNSEIDAVILATPYMKAGRFRDLINLMSVQPFEIKVAPESLGIESVRATVPASADFGGLFLLPVVDKPISDFSFFLKCAIEWAFAALILLMISPLLVLCMIGIKWRSLGQCFSGKSGLAIRARSSSYTSCGQCIMRPARTPR